MRLLAQDHKVPSGLLAKLLQHRRISPETLEVWVQVLKRRDAYFAMEQLGLLESAGRDRPTIDCPPWLFLQLPGMVSNIEDVPYVTSMLRSARFTALDQSKQGLFAARCIQHFLKVRHFVAVRETVEFVCFHAPQIGKASSFARCLEALGSYPARTTTLREPPREMLDSLVQMLLAAMNRRGIEPTLATTLALFAPPLLPRKSRDVTRLVLSLQDLGHEPHRKLLQTAMVAYAREGNAEAAEILHCQIVELDARRQSRQARKDINESSELDQESKADSDKQQELEAADPAALDALSDMPDRPSVSQISTEYYTSASNHNTRLLSLKKDYRAALDYFAACLRFSKDQVDAGLPPIVDRITWATLFYIASNSRSVSSDDLLDVLHKLERASQKPAGHRGNESKVVVKPSRPVLQVYHSVMLGLFRRGDAARVLDLWRKLQSRGLQPDNHLIDVVSRAYCELNQVDQALDLINFYARNPEDPPLSPTFSQAQPLPLVDTTTDSDIVRQPKSRSLQLDAVPLNNLLHYYNRAGQAEKCWTLFNRMQSDYGVDPDAASLSILLDAARYASAAAGSGYGPGVESIHVPVAANNDKWTENRDGWVTKEHAWRVAARVCWDILESQWPGGSEMIRDPLLPAYSGGVLAWLAHRREEEVVDAAEPQSTTTLSNPKLPTEHAQTAFAATLNVTDPPRYPYLFPTERVFRSLIQLLGYHSSARTISLVLAWMKHIGVEPTRHTLALAMMYVDGLGYSDRRMKRFRFWLVRWLGQDKVPTQDEVAFMRRGGGQAGQPVVR